MEKLLSGQPRVFKTTSKRHCFHRPVKLIYFHINKVICAIWYHLYNLKNVKNTYG